jgi:hypothetical protein
VWYPAELCSVGSDTPQDFVRQCIRPHRTLFCGVSDPTEQASAIKHTHLCHCSAGSDTPQDTFGKSFACINYTTQGLYYPCLKKHQSWKWFFVLRGMIPCGTTFEFEYLGEVEIEIKNILEHESGYWIDSWKKPVAKISCYCTFKEWVLYLSGLFSSVLQQCTSHFFKHHPRVIIIRAFLVTTTICLIIHVAR